jgi:hypothetical protein
VDQTARQDLSSSWEFPARHTFQFVLVSAMMLSLISTAGAQNSGYITNEDVIELKSAGISDEIIILRIRSGSAKFSMETEDIVALKSAGVSDAVLREMLKSPAVGSSASAQPSSPLDFLKGAVIFPFESTISDPAAAGLPAATRIAVITILQIDGIFAAVGGPEEAKGKKNLMEITAELVDFSGGNAAIRMIVGLGTGRAHAGFAFTVKESGTGKILWKKTIKETASFWSNSESSSTQRSELPEKVAKTFVEELKKAKIPALNQ